MKTARRPAGGSEAPKAHGARAGRAPLSSGVASS